MLEDILGIFGGDGPDIDVDGSTDSPVLSDFPSDDETDFESDLSDWESKTADMEHSENEYNPAFFGRRGSKMCPTRHGCKGATYCDYAGADYPG